MTNANFKDVLDTDVADVESGAEGTFPGRFSHRADRIDDDAHAIATAEALALSFAKNAVQRDRNRILPWEEVNQFSQSGLWAASVPREYGGAGITATTVARIFAIISAADGSLGHIPQNHFYALEVLRIAGTESQKRYFYRRVLDGERFGNALAEIGHRDFKRRTHLERTDTGIYVTGRKFYCTGALFAHWIPTLVSAQEASGDTMYLVFIPANATGVIITDDWDGFGQRVTGSGSVAFDRVQVQAEWIVPFQVHFDQPSTIGPHAQLLHAAIDLGIGHGAFDAMLPYIRDHARPWIDSGVSRAADDPLTLREIGNVHVRLRAAQALLNRAAQAVDRARGTTDEASVAAASVAVAQAKALCTTAGLLAANALFELAGTSATLGGHALDRYWRNVRTHTLHDPVRWKYHAIGNYVLNGKLPPRHGAI